MTCRELVQLVSDYFEDRLSAEDRARFDEHLAICPDCTEYVAQMRATLHALGSLPEESVSPAARDTLLDTFRNFRS